MRTFWDMSGCLQFLKCMFSHSELTVLLCSCWLYKQSIVSGIIFLVGPILKWIIMYQWSDEIRICKFCFRWQTYLVRRAACLRIWRALSWESRNTRSKNTISIPTLVPFKPSHRKLYKQGVSPNAEFTYSSFITALIQYNSFQDWAHKEYNSRYNWFVNTATEYIMTF
jgi:hypothetical protein